MFANGIGLICLGIALFSLGYTYWGNIEIKKDNEKIIAYIQGDENFSTKYKHTLKPREFYRIGLFWIGFGLIFAMIVWMAAENVLINIIIIGIIIMLYGFIKSKTQREIPQNDTSDEMFN